MRKPDLFTIGLIVFLLNTAQMLDVQAGRDLSGPDSNWQVAKLRADDSLRHADLPANPVRSRVAIVRTGSPLTSLLPVQSRDPDDLATGKLLVASRDLADPIFAKTVVLLIQYDSQSVVGLMMNKRTNIPLSQVFKEFKEAKDRSDLAYAGGPVDLSTVFALVHLKSKREGAHKILEGVYLISTKSEFEKNLSASADPESFRVYLGYAGWTPEQLRQEIRLGAWFIFQGEVDAVFSSSPDSMWSQMIRRTELKMAANDSKSSIARY